MARGGSARRRSGEALLAGAGDDGGGYRRWLDRLAAALGREQIRWLRDRRVPTARRRAALEQATANEPAAIRAVTALLLERDRIDLVGAIAGAFGTPRGGAVPVQVVTHCQGLAFAQLAFDAFQVTRQLAFLPARCDERGLVLLETLRGVICRLAQCFPVPQGLQFLAISPEFCADLFAGWPGIREKRGSGLGMSQCVQNGSCPGS